MQTITDLWHPTLLLFLATLFLPVALFSKRHSLRRIDQGYNAIILGNAIIAVAAFLDYFEEIPVGHALAFQLIGSKFDGIVLPYLYAPGVMLTAYGIYKWLPAVHQVSHEIERRKTAEAELRTLLEEVNLLARQAEEANRSKSEFLATMSHELRTPLNAVIGFTEMLQADMYTEPEKRDEFLGIVADSGRHLLNIINDILDLSRLEAGKIAINAAPFQLCQLMQECVSYTEPRILEKGLGIGLDCDVDGMVSDRRLLKQILLNLLSNAVKFTPNGGHVGLTATGTDKNVVIKVTDSGIGMTAEEIRRAMEPFVQIDNSLARAHEGTGLGLPLVERFTTLLEGRMEIFSEKGQGTTITLTIPRTVSTEAETPGALI